MITEGDWSSRRLLCGLLLLGRWSRDISALDDDGIGVAVVVAAMETWTIQSSANTTETVQLIFISFPFFS